METKQVDVGTTATLLHTHAASGVGPAKVKIAVNDSLTDDLFVGLSGVSTTTGYRIEAGTRDTIELGPGQSLYGVAAALITVSVLVE